MTGPFRSPLARRIACTAATTFATVSAFVLVAVWAVLSSVASSSISVDPPEAEASTPQVVEAVYQLASSTVTSIMIVTATALLGITILGTVISYRAARVSLGRVADISAHTRRITASTLDERLSLAGPPDEIKDLADTIDDTLTKLDEAFDQQERFAANASHELRTPLAVLRTSIESLSKRATVDSMDDTDRALRNALKMEAILDSLMLLAQTKQISSDRRYLVDLSVSLQVAWDDIASEFQARDIAATVEIADGVQTTGDQTLLLQAIYNVLANAARYTPVGGIARFAIRAENEHAVLIFANNGDFVTPEEAMRLVEPFNRGANSRLGDSPGAGLGLSIVNSVVRQHGGTLHVTANAEGGLTVTISLPQRKVGTEERSPAPTTLQESAIT